MTKTLIINFDTHQEIHRNVSEAELRQLFSSAFGDPNQTVRNIIWGEEIIYIKK
jgi:hypothetical protein